MLKYIILSILLLFSIISDIKYSKIRNIYVIPTAIIGISINIIENGYQGLKSSLLGLIIPVFLLGILFYVKLIGAGDVKLFSAIGALFGCEFIINCMAYSFVIAGVFCVIYISKNKISTKLEVMSTLKNIKKIIYDFLLHIQIPSFISPINFQSRESKHIIKLSPYIAMGVCVQIFTNYN